MFRITFDELPTGVTIRIEGRFAGHFAAETRQLIALRKLPDRFAVNLSDVTFVDAPGENALLWLNGIGAKFVANTAYSLYLCQRLNLPTWNGAVSTIPTLSSP